MTVAGGFLLSVVFGARAELAGMWLGSSLNMLCGVLFVNKHYKYFHNNRLGGVAIKDMSHNERALLLTTMAAQWIYYRYRVWQLMRKAPPDGQPPGDEPGQTPDG